MKAIINLVNQQDAVSGLKQVNKQRYQFTDSITQHLNRDSLLQTNINHQIVIGYNNISQRGFYFPQVFKKRFLLFIAKQI